MKLPAEQTTIRAQCFHPSGKFVEFPKEDVETSIPQRFEKIVGLYPDHIAIKTADRAVTYAELNAIANGVARSLIGRPEINTAPVCLLMDNGPELFATMLGTLKAGRFFVLLDPSFPKSRISDFVGNSRANLLVHDQRYSSVARDLGDQCRPLGFDRFDCIDSAQPLEVFAAPSDYATIFYTSGSTGQPKGVIQTHRSLLHYMMRRSNAFHTSPADRVSLLSSGTSNVVSNAFAALLCGAALMPFAVKQEGLIELSNWLLAERISICLISPQLFRSLCDGLKQGNCYPDLRLVRLTSDAARASDFELFRKYFSSRCVLVSGLSSSETGVIRKQLMNASSQVFTHELPVGYPLEDMEVLLVDQKGEPVGFDRVGEIVVRSRYLASGYWHNSELTAAKFRPDPQDPEKQLYHTGDLGLMFLDGCLIHKGREDFRVKIRGYGVDLAEVEKTLLSHPGIIHAIVDGQAGEDGTTRLIAYFTSDRNRVATVSELRAYLKTRLADYMVPVRFIRLEKIPLTSNGKIDRSALPRINKSRPYLDSAWVAPRSQTERSVAEIWEQVLDVRPIGVVDDFFNLGGHSVAAIRLVARVLQMFRIKVPLKALFDAPTVAAMAAVIETNLTKRSSREDVDLMVRELEAMTEERARALLKEATQGKKGIRESQ